MHSSRTYARLFSLPLVAALAVSCSGGIGLSCLEAYPAGTHYTGPKSDNAINIRLSRAGVNYINTQWQTLIGAFAPGGTIQVPVGCTFMDDVVSTDVWVCTAYVDAWLADQNANRSCEAGEQANVSIQITGLQLVPIGPTTLRVSVSLAIDTGTINLSAKAGCGIFSCSLTCGVRFNNAPNGNTIGAQMDFSIDTRFDKLLAFNLNSISGTQVCGASGAPPPPNCLNPNSLSISSVSGACDFGCDILGNNDIKRFILQQLSNPLQNIIGNMLTNVDCQSCNTNADCPMTTDGTNQQATCISGGSGGLGGSGKICSLNGACVPMMLGTEGRMNMYDLLGSFGAPPTAAVELYAAAGATAATQTDGGISIGTRVGIKPTQVSGCVPLVPQPALVPVDFPDFDGEATPGGAGDPGYQFGLGISSSFINQAMWGVQQSGALCLAIGSETVDLISTDLFSTFLPSLGKVATRDGKGAPMVMVLRPAAPPEVHVGEGTYDPVTNKPIKPLLTLAMKDLSIDFYALIDDRNVRLFTLTADVSIPLSLIFTGCDSITPALGDLNSLITNIRTANSEILAEDPQVLADLVPTLIGVAEPALGSALGAIALPSLGTFKLRVREAKGVGRVAPGSDDFNHLAIFADLMDVNAACAVSAPKMKASLKRAVMPEAKDMVATGKRAIPWPKAVLDVSASGKAGSPQFSWKVDKGMWTDFVVAEGGELTVAHPVLALQGTHTISVRARIAEDPAGVSAIEEVPFVVDYAAPEVTLSTDEAADRVVVKARDAVSTTLEYAYQLGDGARSDFGPAQEISLSAAEQLGGVTVFARDALGNVGHATWKAPRIAQRASVSDDGEQPGALRGAGCSAGGEWSAVALALAGLLRRRHK